MSDVHPSPGWQAIDEALRPIYGRTEPQHYGTMIKWALGGGDPLDGVSVYWREARGGVPAHWHYVSYGLTELYEKESELAEVSGFGFELTFRLVRPVRDAQPPVWPLNLMQNLARYVFQTGNTFGPGHHLNANGPIAVEETTKLTALLFAEDPELPMRETPNGKMGFLQGIGITADELAAVQGWSSTPFTELLAARAPLLTTDLARASMLEDPAMVRLVAERSRAEGSSIAELMVSEWKVARQQGRTRIVMGAQAADGLLKHLGGRLGHGQPLVVRGPGDADGGVTVFKSGSEAALAGSGGTLDVSLTPAALASLTATLRPVRGVYRIAELPSLEIQVVPTEIKDKDGKVVSVVG